MLTLIFVTILFSVFVLSSFLLKLSSKEAALEARLQGVLIPPKAVAVTQDTLERPAKRTGQLSLKLGGMVQRFGLSDSIRTLIQHAGSSTTVGAVVGVSIVAALAAGLTAHLMVGSLLVDVVAFGAGAASRWSSLTFLKRRRLKKFTSALPDAIELIARALRAGHSMSSAIEIVAEQSPQPLSDEFIIVFQQQKFGVPFRDALLQLGDRVPSKDLHFLITATLVQKETGGDLTEILDRTTHVIRERVRIEGEIKTYTAQGRLTGWILSALPVIMLGLINIVTPGYSHVLFHDPLGQTLMYAGGTLIIVGGLIIRKIVDIKV